MLHSGQSFPGTPALPCSTTGTGPGGGQKMSEKVRNFSQPLVQSARLIPWLYTK